MASMVTPYPISSYALSSNCSPGVSPFLVRNTRHPGFIRGPWTLALCLPAVLGMTLAIFCRLVSKTHCCRLNHLNLGFTLTQYLTMHVSILDHIRHLNLTFQGHPRSNVMMVLDTPYMISCWCLIATYGLTQLLHEI